MKKKRNDWECDCAGCKRGSGCLIELAEIECELKRIADVENKFKCLGKFLYSCWKDKKAHNFELIMEEFDSDLTKLHKEAKNNDSRF